jgi:6-hydroxycyclohex-1-ene-1-carbonyl-CoA dehydrogenase
VVPGATSDPDAPIGPAGLTLRTLAVVADAVTTPYQAIQRSGLERRDTAIVVGVGGIGGYAAQLARLRGAEVVAIDPDPARLLTVPDVGLAINPTGIEGKQIREQVRAHCKEAGSRDRAWKIFECSGSPAGQRTAFDLLGFGATMMVVGHTHEPVEVRLSNLMAFDARLIGTWGCAPEHYADVVEIVCAGLVDVAGRTETRPLASINETLTEIRDHGPTRRVVLVPDEN